MRFILLVEVFVAISCNAASNAPPPLPPGIGDPVFQLHRHSLAAYQNAKCLDGSPASYHFRKNPDAAENPIWAVMLPASPGCYYDNAGAGKKQSCKATCQSRSATGQSCNGTTTETVNQFYVDGLLYWMAFEKKAHIARIYPCFGDAYQGGGNAQRGDYYYNGDSAIEAMFQDLQSKHGLGSSGGKELVVLYGVSSGGVGAVYHLDRVSGYLGKPSNVHTLGLFDSPMPLLPCLHAGDQTACEALLTKESDSEWNNFYYTYKWLAGQTSWRTYGDKCTSAHSIPECAYPEYHLKYVSRPYMLIANVFDKFLTKGTVFPEIEVSANVCTQGPCSDAKALAEYTASTYEKLGITASRRAFYEVPCYGHATSEDQEGFYATTVDGTAMSDAVDYFIFRGNGKDWTQGPAVESHDSEWLSWSERCSGFSCGTGCPTHCAGACRSKLRDTIPGLQPSPGPVPSRRANFTKADDSALRGRAMLPQQF